MTSIRWWEKVVYALVLFWAVLVFWPISFWYEVGDVVFPDAMPGQEIELEYNGKVVRPFLGSYSVVVREFTTQEVICETNSGRFNYRTGTKRPDPLTMEWWAAGDARCHALPNGIYTVDTCWSIWDAFWGIVPAKSACVRSVLRVV